MPAFNITEARENIRNIQNQLDRARDRARHLLAAPDATAEEMDKQAATIQQLNARLNLANQELQQGEFIWKARSNGNLGLVWKGVTS